MNDKNKSIYLGYSSFSVLVPESGLEPNFKVKSLKNSSTEIKIQYIFL